MLIIFHPTYPEKNIRTKAIISFKRVISLVILISFIATSSDIALARELSVRSNASTLSPNNRFDPITDTEEERALLAGGFRETAEFLYINKAICRAVAMNFTDADELIAWIRDDLNGRRLNDLDYTKIYRSHDAFYLPIRNGDAGAIALMRYFRLKGDEVSPYTVKLSWNGEVIIGLEFIDPATGLPISSANPVYEGTVDPISSGSPGAVIPEVELVDGGMTDELKALFNIQRTKEAERKAGIALDKLVRVLEPMLEGMKTLLKDGRMAEVSGAAYAIDKRISECFNDPDIQGMGMLLRKDLIYWQTIPFSVEIGRAEDVLHYIGLMEAALGELKELSGMGRLCCLEDARVSSGVLDASRVLINDAHAYYEMIEERSPGLFKKDPSTGRYHLDCYPKFILGSEYDVRPGADIVYSGIDGAYTGLESGVFIPGLDAFVMDNHSDQLLAIKLGESLELVEGKGKTLVHVDRRKHHDLAAVNNFTGYRKEDGIEGHARYLREVLNPQIPLGVQSHITPLIFDGTVSKIIHVVNDEDIPAGTPIRTEKVYIIGGRTGEPGLPYTEGEVLAGIDNDEGASIMAEVMITKVPLSRLEEYIAPIPEKDRILGLDVDLYVSETGEVKSDGLAYWRDTKLKFAVSCFSTSPGYADQPGAIEFCREVLSGWRRREAASLKQPTLEEQGFIDNILEAASSIRGLTDVEGFGAAFLQFLNAVNTLPAGNYMVLAGLMKRLLDEAASAGGLRIEGLRDLMARMSDHFEEARRDIEDREYAGLRADMESRSRAILRALGSYDASAIYGARSILGEIYVTPFRMLTDSIRELSRLISGRIDALERSEQERKRTESLKASVPATLARETLKMHDSSWDALSDFAKSKDFVQRDLLDAANIHVSEDARRLIGLLQNPAGDVVAEAEVFLAGFGDTRISLISSELYGLLEEIRKKIETFHSKDNSPVDAREERIRGIRHFMGILENPDISHTPGSVFHTLSYWGEGIAEYLEAAGIDPSYMAGLISTYQQRYDALPPKRRPSRSSDSDVIVVGASMLGWNAIRSFIANLPDGHPPVIISEHLMAHLGEGAELHRDYLDFLEFTDEHNRHKPGKIEIVRHKAGRPRRVFRIERSGILVGANIIIERDGDNRRVAVSYQDTDLIPARYKPVGREDSVDRLFLSASEHFGDKTVCVVLSGAGSDGTAGAAAVNKNGGKVFIEREDDSTYYIDVMPESVSDSRIPHMAYPAEKLGRAIMNKLSERGKRPDMRPERAVDERPGQKELLKSGKPLEFDDGLLYHGRDGLDKVLLQEEVRGYSPLTRAPQKWAIHRFVRESKSPAVFVVKTSVFNSMLSRGLAHMSVDEEGNPYPEFLGPVKLEDIEEVWIDEVTDKRYEEMAQNPASPDDIIMADRFGTLLASGKVKVVPDLNHDNPDRNTTLHNAFMAIGRYFEARHLADRIPGVRERVVKKISDVEQLKFVPQEFTSVDQVRQFVEEPLIEACEILFHKNIKTTMTSANKLDLERSKDGVNHYAWIDIFYDSLSDVNKKLVDSIMMAEERIDDIKVEGFVLKRDVAGKTIEENYIRALIPITPESTVAEVSGKAARFAHLFEKQDTQKSGLRITTEITKDGARMVLRDRKPPAEMRGRFKEPPEMEFVDFIRSRSDAAIEEGRTLNILDVGFGYEPQFLERLSGVFLSNSIPAKMYGIEPGDSLPSNSGLDAQIEFAKNRGITLESVSLGSFTPAGSKIARTVKFDIIFINAPDFALDGKMVKNIQAALKPGGVLIVTPTVFDTGLRIGTGEWLKNAFKTDVEEMKLKGLPATDAFPHLGDSIIAQFKTTGAKSSGKVKVKKPAKTEKAFEELKTIAVDLGADDLADENIQESIEAIVSDAANSTEIANAVMRLAIHVHDGRYAAIITSGRSDEIVVRLFETAWRSLYPEETMPSLYRLGTRINKLLYSLDPDYLKDMDPAKALKVMEDSFTKEELDALMALREDKVIFLDDRSRWGIKPDHARAIFHDKLGFGRFYYGVIAADAKPAAIPFDPETTFAGTNDPTAVESMSHVSYLMSEANSHEEGSEAVRRDTEEAMRSWLSAINSNPLPLDWVRPGYQKVEEIIIREAGEDVADAPAVHLGLDPDQPLEKAITEVRGRLISANWWFQPYWVDKGLPKEQITLRIEDHIIDIYNWNEAPLTGAHISQIEHVVKMFARIAGGKALMGCRYILIDDRQETNVKSGEEMNGYSMANCKAITLYPRAMRPVEFRIAGVPNLTGTLIHEFSHQLSEFIIQDGGRRDMLVNLWLKQFGWHFLKRPRELPGGSQSFWLADEPARCVTNYATHDPSEDICESMVAAIMRPSELSAADAGKLELLREVVLKDLPDMDGLKEIDVYAERHEGADISLPRHEGAVAFRRAGRLMIGLVKSGSGEKDPGEKVRPEPVAHLIAQIKEAMVEVSCDYPVWLFGSAGIKGMPEATDIDIAVPSRIFEAKGHYPLKRRILEKVFGMKTVKKEDLESNEHVHVIAAAHLRTSGRGWHPLRHKLAYRLEGDSVLAIRSFRQMQKLAGEDELKTMRDPGEVKSKGGAPAPASAGTGLGLDSEPSRAVHRLTQTDKKILGAVKALSANVKPNISKRTVAHEAVVNEYSLAKRVRLNPVVRSAVEGLLVESYKLRSAETGQRVYRESASFAGETVKDTVLSANAKSPSINVPSPDAYDLSQGASSLSGYISENGSLRIVSAPYNDPSRVADILMKGEVVRLDFKGLPASKPDDCPQAEHAFFNIALGVERALDLFFKDKGATSQFAQANQDFCHDLKEILKNSFAHGNKANPKLPVYLKLSFVGNGVKVDIYDTASPDSDDSPARQEARSAKIYGFGKGESGMDAESYAREPVLDDRGQIIGAQSTLIAEAPPKGENDVRTQISEEDRKGQGIGAKGQGTKTYIKRYRPPVAEMRHDLTARSSVPMSAKEQAERIKIALRSMNHGPATDVVNRVARPEIILMRMKLEEKEPEIFKVIKRAIDDIYQYSKLHTAVSRPEDASDEFIVENVLSSLVTKSRRARTSYNKAMKAVSQYESEHATDAEFDHLLLNRFKEGLKEVVDMIDSRTRFAKGSLSLDLFDIRNIVNLCTRRGCRQESDVFAGIRNVSLPEDTMLIKGDKISLLNALSNIVINAKQAAGDKGQEDLVIDVSLTMEKDEAVIRITDNAGGIREDLLEMGQDGRQKIFELDRTTKEKGTGLGMAETWYAIRDHSGKIEIQNLPGKGATFIIRLPLATTKTRTRVNKTATDTNLPAREVYAKMYDLISHIIELRLTFRQITYIPSVYSWNVNREGIKFVDETLFGIFIDHLDKDILPAIQSELSQGGSEYGLSDSEKDNLIKMFTGLDLFIGQMEYFAQIIEEMEKTEKENALAIFSHWGIEDDPLDRFELYKYFAINLSEADRKDAVNTVHEMRSDFERAKLLFDELRKPDSNLPADESVSRSQLLVPREEPVQPGNSNQVRIEGDTADVAGVSPKGPFQDAQDAPQVVMRTLSPEEAAKLMPPGGAIFDKKAAMERMRALLNQTVERISQTVMQTISENGVKVKTENAKFSRRAFLQSVATVIAAETVLKDVAPAILEISPAPIETAPINIAAMKGVRNLADYAGRLRAGQWCQTIGSILGIEWNTDYSDTFEQFMEKYIAFQKNPAIFQDKSIIEIIKGVWLESEDNFWWQFENLPLDRVPSDVLAKVIDHFGVRTKALEYVANICRQSGPEFIREFAKLDRWDRRRLFYAIAEPGASDVFKAKRDRVENELADSRRELEELRERSLAIPTDILKEPSTTEWYTGEDVAVSQRIDKLEFIISNLETMLEGIKELQNMAGVLKDMTSAGARSVPKPDTRTPIPDEIGTDTNLPAAKVANDETRPQAAVYVDVADKPVNWHEVFGNDNPIFVEIGYGDGRVLAAESKKHPERNYIGIDIAGISRKAIDGLGLGQNVRLVQGHGGIILGQNFEDNSIEEVSIIFPDPGNVRDDYVSPEPYDMRLLKPSFMQTVFAKLRSSGTLLIVSNESIDKRIWHEVQRIIGFHGTIQKLSFQDNPVKAIGVSLEESQLYKAFKEDKSPVIPDEYCVIKATKVKEIALNHSADTQTIVSGSEQASVDPAGFPRNDVTEYGRRNTEYEETASTFVNKLKRRAYELKSAKQGSEPIIIAVETNGYIPTEQKGMIQPLLRELSQERLGTDFAKIGLDNVKFVQGTGEALKAELLKVKSETGAKPKNVIVLGTKNLIDMLSSADELMGDTEDDSAFFAEMDISEIQGLRYIRLLEMLLITLKAAYGERVSQSDHPMIEIHNIAKRYILLKPIEKADYNNLPEIYKKQAETLQAA